MSNNNLSTSLVTELKAMTEQAIQTGEKLRKEKQLQIKADNEQKLREQKIKAQGIIELIPSRCKKAAEDEKNSCVVMNLEYGKDHEVTNNKLRYSQLKGVGAIVWNACQGAKLNPTLEYWHDGAGIESGFNLVVNW